MRDERGRYTATKRIEDIVPAWARGCDDCANGIVLAPELTGAVPLYMERLVQAIDQDITFCSCRAGKAYRSSLLNRRQQIIEQSRKEAKATSILDNSSPIDSARAAIHAAQARNTPTVHVAGERVPA